jgi:hypothetical protein
MRVLVAVLLLVFLALPARAGSGLAAQFEVRVFGLPVGALVIRRSDDGAGGYAGEGRFATTGVVGLLARVWFEMHSRGQMRRMELAPRFYAEVMDTGKGPERSEAAFRPGDGRLDPLAAILTDVAPRPVSAGCAANREIFDGVRTNRLILVEQSRADDAITCAGEYRRVAGYSAQELARQPGYRLSITYRVTGDQMMADRVQSASDFGAVTLLRRASAGGG